MVTPTKEIDMIYTKLTTELQQSGVYAFAYTLNDMTYVKVGQALNLADRLSTYATVLDGGISVLFVEVPRGTLNLAERTLRDLVAEELPNGWVRSTHENSNRKKETFEAMREDLAWKQRGEAMFHVEQAFAQWSR